VLYNFSLFGPKLFFFEVLFNDWNVNVFNNFLVEFEKNHNMIE